MRATKLSISKSALVNLGDYQNEKVEMTLEYEIEPGETAEQAHAQASEEFKTLLLKELEPTFVHLSSYKREAWLERLGIEKPKPVEEVVPDDEDDDLGDTGDDDDDRPTEEDFEKAGDLDGDEPDQQDWDDEDDDSIDDYEVGDEAD